MRSIEATGKSVDAAIFNGLAQLGVSIDEVSIDIIQTETKGILGIGARSAIVRLTEKPPEEVVVPDFSQERRRDDFRSNRGGFRDRDRDRRPYYDRQRRSFKDDRQAQSGDTAAPRSREDLRQDADVSDKDEAIRPAPESAEGLQSAPAESVPADEAQRPARSERRSGGARPPRSKSARPYERSENKAPAAEINYTQEAAENNIAADFVKTLILYMGVEANVLAAVEEDCIRLRIDSDAMGVLIGHRGETLDAMQYLTSLVVNRDRKSASYTRVNLDMEDYREKRAESLVRLARKVAAQVKSTGRARALEPMNPYERRILHSALQGNPFVTTHSEGEDPNRRVVVVPRRRSR